MKVLHLNHSDSIGGAAKFSRRLHDSLLSIGVDSYMCCSSVKLNDSRVFRISPEISQPMGLFRAKLAQTLDSKLNIFEKTAIKSFKSPGWIGAVGADWINQSDFDVVNLHWINGGLISIKEIGNIKKPIVWSMLDMWPFLGAEHYCKENVSRGISVEFAPGNRPKGDLGLDICKISARLKKRFLSDKISYIAPSKWLAEHAEKSQRLNKVKVNVIPAAIDTEFFSPESKKSIRDKSASSFVIGYGGALSDRKGWQLINKFLNTYNEDLVGSTIIVFGSPISSSFESPYYDIIQAGRIKNEHSLIDLYRKLDVLLFPSTLETFGLIAQEAQSCGVPVICISNTGTEDVIESEKTGYSISGSLDELISILSRLKSYPELSRTLGVNSRNRALSLWRPDIVANQYLDIYQSQK